MNKKDEGSDQELDEVLTHYRTAAARNTKPKLIPLEAGAASTDETTGLPPEQPAVTDQQ